jgi:hypothetical protein
MANMSLDPENVMNSDSHRDEPAVNGASTTTNRVKSR